MVRCQYHYKPMPHSDWHRKRRALRSGPRGHKPSHASNAQSWEGGDAHRRGDYAAALRMARSREGEFNCESLPTLNGDSRSLSLFPNGIGYTSEPIDCEGLDRKQDDCDLDNDKLLGLRDDPERNDQSRRSRRRMTYPEQSHERACSRERERGGQHPWAMDTGVH